MSDQPYLEVKGVSKTYMLKTIFSGSKQVKALQDISFKLGRGEAWRWWVKVVPVNQLAGGPLLACSTLMRAIFW